MKYLITGGSGFVGKQLAMYLLSLGHHVITLDIGISRINHPHYHHVVLNLQDQIDPKLFEGVHGVIHLAGAPIFARWTNAYKQALRDSRIKTLHNVLSSIEKNSQKPNVFITASAVGYYGDAKEEWCDESRSSGVDFLAKLCVDWEEEAQKAKLLGMRVVVVRNGYVIGSGGILNTLHSFFRFGLGAWFGKGDNWMSWVHIKDLVHIYEQALHNADWEGVCNAVSPNPVRQKDFMKMYARSISRYALFGIPQWVAKMVYGEFSEALVSSQRVSPGFLKNKSFEFLFPFFFDACKKFDESVV